MVINNHRLEQARQISSPNHNVRPVNEEISLLLIHNISLPPGRYGGKYIDDLFCNQLDCTVDPFFEQIKDLNVSSHLLINRKGEVTQYVPFDRQAWHAGVSAYENKERCNEFSIGIELEGTDEDVFTDEQYVSLLAITKVLFIHYPHLCTERIVGHCDVAPGRKTDPGPGFDWNRYKNGLNKG